MIKRLAALILSLLLVFGLTGCCQHTNATSFEKEIVTATVVDFYDKWYDDDANWIKINYEGKEQLIHGHNLCEDYKNRLGDTIDLYLFTRIYECGCIEYEFVYNEEVYQKGGESDDCIP